jgi:RNA polymerase sigma-70 factor (ECF subfamily)
MQKGCREVQVAKTESLAFGLNPSRKDLAERRLVEAAQRGDQGAFTELVRRYDRSVLRIALRLLSSREDAQDAYQEAFLKVYRKLDGFRFQCRFHTWLYRITTNVCLDQLRRRKSRREFGVFDTDEQAGRSPLQRAADTRPGSSPAQMLGSGEISERISVALDKLSDRERVVFVLRHYEGMRLRPIGEACGMSEESAKQSLFRATKKLRKELRDVRA